MKGGATCGGQGIQGQQASGGGSQAFPPTAAAAAGEVAKTHLGTNWAEAMTFLTSPGPTSMIRAFSASIVRSRGRPARPAGRGLPPGGSVLPRPSW